MKKTDSDIPEVSFFDKMKITPVQKHELDKVGREFFNILDSLYYNARSASATLKDDHFSKPELDPQKQTSDDKLANLCINFSRKITESFYKQAVIAAGGNEMAAYDKMSSTIVEFVKHSRNTYQLNFVVPRNTLNGFITQDLLEEKFDTVMNKMELLENLKMPASAEASAFVGVYVKTLSALTSMNFGDINKSITEMNQKLEYPSKFLKSDKIPDPVVNHESFEKLALKYNISLN